MVRKKAKIDNQQSDFFGAQVIDFTKEVARRDGKQEESCLYKFTDLVVPTLHCQHEHRVLLVDPARSMEVLAALIRRGELELAESERYTQLPLRETKLWSRENGAINCGNSPRTNPTGT